MQNFWSKLWKVSFCDHISYIKVLILTEKPKSLKVHWLCVF